MEHRRPNLRMNDQVLRVFNGFYKQIFVNQNYSKNILKLVQ
jgi:hypothetical protein